VLAKITYSTPGSSRAFTLPPAGTEEGHLTYLPALPGTFCSTTMETGPVLVMRVSAPPDAVELQFIEKATSSRENQPPYAFT